MSYANTEQGVPVIIISSSAIEGLNALATADLNTYLATLGALWTFNGGLDVGVSGSNRFVLRGGAEPTLTVDGTTDINLFISAKGTGTVQFYQSIKVDVLKANYIQISGAATGAKPSIQALGADADISITITPKGAGTFDIRSSLNVGFNLANYLQLSGSATGNALAIKAIGTDANISVDVFTKGAGLFTWKGDQLTRTAYTTAISAITVGASPFTYTNAGVTPVQAFITGGTVTEVAYSRDEATFFVIGVVTAQMVLLAPGDSVRVTYTAKPTMNLIPM